MGRDEKTADPGLDRWAPLTDAERKWFRRTIGWVVIGFVLGAASLVFGRCR